jgi:hypothetical protein
MKNIQVIDGAENCVFDIFAATDDEFSLIFRPREDVAFIDEVYQRGTAQELDAALGRIWNGSTSKGAGRVRWLTTRIRLVFLRIGTGVCAHGKTQESEGPCRGPLAIAGGMAMLAP